MLFLPCLRYVCDTHREGVDEEDEEDDEDEEEDGDDEVPLVVPPHNVAQGLEGRCEPQERRLGTSEDTRMTIVSDTKI